MLQSSRAAVYERARARQMAFASERRSVCSILPAQAYCSITRESVLRATRSRDVTVLLPLPVLCPQMAVRRAALQRRPCSP